MHDQIGHWGSQLARTWTNYCPPCRPSNSEILVYTKYLRESQNKLSRKPKLLILGSTSEFRDWGHEENLDVSVVDFSTGYNKVITEQMKYKNVQETFYHQSWQTIDFKNEYDIIIGDLVIGNLQASEIPHFLLGIKQALKPTGYFMTKSFFRDEKYEIRKLDKIILGYLSKNLPYHPFSYLIYDIALSCMNIDTNILNFKNMFDSIYSLYQSKTVSSEFLEYFANLGWQNDMKFEFYIPTISDWEKMVNFDLHILKKEFGSDIYSPNFPIYIITKELHK